MSKKILIFGATGSVGSSLTKLVKESSMDAHLIGKNEDEISNLKDQTGFSYSIADVTDPNFIENVKKEIKNNNQIVEVLNDIQQTDDPALIASYEALYAQEVRLAESKANTDSHNVNIKRLDNEIAGLNSEKAPVDKKIATAENAVKEISERFPGTTLQNVAEKCENV